MENHSQTKEKIIFILKRRGPSLPVHIAKEIEQSILFTSAFLSELLSENQIKISNMRVGSSPIYFIPGQEYLLERFSQHLGRKEKESFLLLKEKKFLKDNEQNPAIRVALRTIKDFAIAFKKNDEIFWRYFTIPENEFKEEPKISSPLTINKKISEQSKPKLSEPASEKELSTQEKPESKKEYLDIFDKKEEKPKKTIHKKTIHKKPSEKKNEKFFNKIKEFLSKKAIEISDIESFSKQNITLRVIKQEKEYLLFAHNKKRINEKDIIKAHKKALELNCPYILLSLGEPLKKLTSLIKAIKGLEEIEKIE